VLENWKHKMVISVQYGMSIMLTVVFQEPAAIALDLRIFKHAPVTFSYLRSVSANAGIPSDRSQAGLCHPYMSLPLFMFLCQF